MYKLKPPSYSQILAKPEHANASYILQDIISQLPKNVTQQLSEGVIRSDLSLLPLSDLNKVKDEIIRLLRLEILRLPLPPIVNINLEEQVKFLLKSTNDINELIQIYWRMHSIYKTYIDNNFIEDFSHDCFSFLEKHCEVKGVTRDDLDGFKMGLKPNLMVEFNSMVSIQKSGETIYVFDLDGCDVKSMNTYCHRMAYRCNKPKYERSLGDLFIFLFNKAILNIKSRLEKDFPDLEFSAGHTGGDESLIVLKTTGPNCISRKLISDLINSELSKYSWGEAEQKFQCRVDEVNEYAFNTQRTDIQLRHMSTAGVPLTKKELQRYSQGGDYVNFINQRIEQIRSESERISDITNFDYKDLLNSVLSIHSLGSQGYREFIDFFGNDREGRKFEAKRAIYLEERKTYLSRVIKYRTIDYSGVENMIRELRLVSTVFSFNPIKNINAVSYPAGNLTIEYNVLTILKRFFREVLNVQDSDLNKLTIENWKEYLIYYKQGVLPDNMSVELVLNGLDIGLVVYIKRGETRHKDQSEKISKMIQEKMDGSESVTIQSESDFRHSYVFTTIGTHNMDSTTKFRDIMERVITRNNIESMRVVTDRLLNLSDEEILRLETLMKSRKKEDLKLAFVMDNDILSANFETWNNRSNSNIEAISYVLYERLVGASLIQGGFEDNQQFLRSKLNSLLQKVQFKSHQEKIEIDKIICLTRIITDLIKERGITSPNARSLVNSFNRLNRSNSS